MQGYEVYWMTLNTWLTKEQTMKMDWIDILLTWHSRINGYNNIVQSCPYHKGFQDTE